MLLLFLPQMVALLLFYAYYYYYCCYYYSVVDIIIIPLHRPSPLFANVTLHVVCRVGISCYCIHTAPTADESSVSPYVYIHAIDTIICFISLVVIVLQHHLML